MIEIISTETFDSWLDGLRDAAARRIIAGRVRRLAFGLMGDVRPVGEGVSELRIHHGPGYRVSFIRRGQILIIVLCGGTKRNQRQDIEGAKRLAASF